MDDHIENTRIGVLDGVLHAVADFVAVEDGHVGGNADVHVDEETDAAFADAGLFDVADTLHAAGEADEAVGQFRLRRLQSQIASKQLEVRGQRAQRWPRVDLIAQYGLLAKFNNYDQYFRTFQRNNGQIGMSFQVPVLSGSGISAAAAQAQTDVAHLKVEMTAARNRIASDVQQSIRQARRAGASAELARLDLDVAREQLSVNLAQMQEGRLTLREVEQARIVENQKWIAFYDAQYAAEKARWNVARVTGALLQSIRALP